MIVCNVYYKSLLVTSIMFWTSDSARFSLDGKSILFKILGRVTFKGGSMKLSNSNTFLTNLMVLACLTCAMSVVVSAQEKEKAKTGTEALPGIDWSVDQLKKAVAPVRPGRVLLPEKWPNNAREGLPRIIAMLDRFNVPATFFTPAVSAILAPEMIPQILKSGKNEVALHGWIHESVDVLNDGAKEEKLLGQAVDYLTKVSGKKPVGSRTGSWAFSSYTISVDRNLGLTYDSSLMAMDVPYEIMSNGKDTGIVELPVTWVADDGIYFGPTGALPSPKVIFQVFQDEFDMAYRERTFVMLTFHPNAERRSRFLYLEQLIAYMKTKPDVWFATAEQVVDWIKSNPTTDSSFSRMPEQQ
jgi:peptidoglycan-N-acetylglucosamine deacetylase